MSTLPPNPFDLSGHHVLVTGASSGLGAHFAGVLAQHGARVSLAARRKDRLEALADRLGKEGAEVTALAMDVTSADSVREAFDRAEDAFGTVNLVSNNAGVADARLALEIDEQGWQQVMSTNVDGVWRVAMETARRLIAAEQPGSIVNTASILGLRPAISQSSYATSKAAVVQLTKNLALEWSRKGIRVNALCPGYFITEMNRDFLTSDRGKAYLATTPAQRAGELPELDAALLLLLSDAGRFINGVALPIDGAHSLGNM